MKKLSLLMSTLGGTAAFYILSNSKLRKELSKARNPQEMLEVIKKHTSRDGSKIAKEVQELVTSDEVQGKIAQAKLFTEDSVTKAKQGLSGLWSKAKNLTDSAIDAAKKKMGE
ncbi:MAG: hypothetical protein Q7R81_03845 [Candidatus Peregrinibacteria bacterium]|nr:hypothetical protein [Candidatus Peregrinibacteria bacterium]